MLNAIDMVRAMTMVDNPTNGGSFRFSLFIHVKVQFRLSLVWGLLTHPSNLFVQVHPHSSVDLDVVHAEESRKEPKWKL